MEALGGGPNGLGALSHRIVRLCLGPALVGTIGTGGVVSPPILEIVGFVPPNNPTAVTLHGWRKKVYFERDM